MMYEILKKYNWPPRTTSDKTNLVDIEKGIGFQLPGDYRNFLLRYRGHETQIGEEYIKLWGIDDLLRLNQDYKILENLSATIGIGSNGAGEFIGIEKPDDDQPRIILTPFIDLDEQLHIEIGKSFTDFLVRLDKGEEWFR